MQAQEKYAIRIIIELAKKPFYPIWMGELYKKLGMRLALMKPALRALRETDLILKTKDGWIFEKSQLTVGQVLQKIGSTLDSLKTCPIHDIEISSELCCQLHGNQSRLYNYYCTTKIVQLAKLEIKRSKQKKQEQLHAENQR